MYDILSRLFDPAVEEEMTKKHNPTPHGPVNYRSHVDSANRSDRRARLAEIKRNRRKQTKRTWRQHRAQRFEGMLARGRAVHEARSAA